MKMAILSDKKTKLLIFFIVLCSFFSLDAKGTQIDVPADTFFLSYPRSGKNLLVSYIRALTDKPI